MHFELGLESVEVTVKDSKGSELLKDVLITSIFQDYFGFIFNFEVVELYKNRYNDVAKHGFVAMGKDKPPAAVMTGEKEASITQTGSDKPAGLGG